MGQNPDTEHRWPTSRPEVRTSPLEVWQSRFPWTVAGMTLRAPGAQHPNFGLYTQLPAGEAMEAWRALVDEVGARAAVHSRQVHGDRVAVHGAEEPPGDGLWIAGDGDGHVTDRTGVLLTVTVADCVPVFVLDPVRRAIALLHAGWRGAAAGIVERGFSELSAAYGSDPRDCWVHLGTSICGSCYEVGPEVRHAFGLPPAPTLDLRRVLASKAHSTGIPSGQITVDHDCTLCGQDRYFSHRGGDPGRQVAFLMMRDPA